MRSRDASSSDRTEVAWRSRGTKGIRNFYKDGDGEQTFRYTVHTRTPTDPKNSNGDSLTGRLPGLPVVSVRDGCRDRRQS